MTGGTGQVGRALARSRPAGMRLLTPGREELDLYNTPDLLPLLERENVRVILNCGAYTAVDRAEAEPDLAHAANAVAPGLLARAAAQAFIPIIHLSTDYVFPAGRAGPWHEGDPIEPASVYGRTKAEGEAAVRNSGARYAIIRTAWILSADGSNFVKTMLQLGRDRRELRVVSDQRGTPTHAGDLAAALIEIANRFTDGAKQASGTWHCVNEGETTWHGLATYVFSCAARLGSKVPEHVEPITTAQYPTPARRPRDSRLATTALQRDYGIQLRPWQDAVAEIVAELVNKESFT